MKISEYDKPPDNTVILNGWDGEVHYADSFQADILNPDKLSVDELAKMILASESPAWVKMLGRLRDSMVTMFGLKTGMDMDRRPEKPGPTKNRPGDMIAFFPVIIRQESEVVMGLDDKHLYFRVSVSISNNQRTDLDSVFINTVVQFHNIWGRIYFYLVKPFHKIIVKQSIKRFLNQHKELMPKDT